MQIYNLKNNISFDAKLNLNDKTFLKNTALLNKKTSLDTMFNENILVKKLDDFTIDATKNLLKRTFVDKQNSKKQKLIQIGYKIIFLLRILADRIFLLSNEKSITSLEKEFSKIATESKSYIEELAKIGNSLKEKYIVTNLEDKVLESITDDNEASLFVLNHPNYHKDKFIYAILSSLMSKLYVQKNLQENCPRPKILVSKNLQKIIHEKVVNIYKKIGLTAVDASLDSSKKDKLSNAYTIKRLLNEFVENKSNIFIFPEGNNSLRVDKTLKERMQPGVSDIIRKALELKPRVRVIPIGIDYSTNLNKNNLGNIYIGTPLHFIKSNDYIQVQNQKNKPFNHQIEEENAKSNIQKIICDSLEQVVNLAKKLKP